MSARCSRIMIQSPSVLKIRAKTNIPLLVIPCFLHFKHPSACENNHRKKVSNMIEEKYFTSVDDIKLHYFRNQILGYDIISCSYTPSCRNQSSIFAKHSYAKALLNS